jgi:hypothetical protein
MAGDKAQAIADILQDIRIHREWADWIRANPEAAAGPAPQVDTAGDVAHHEHWISRLENVLSVLEAA